MRSVIEGVGNVIIISVLFKNYGARLSVITTSIFYDALSFGILYQIVFVAYFNYYSLLFTNVSFHFVNDDITTNIK